MQIKFWLSFKLYGFLRLCLNYIWKGVFISLQRYHILHYLTVLYTHSCAFSFTNDICICDFMTCFVRNDEINCDIESIEGSVYSVYIMQYATDGNGLYRCCNVLHAYLFSLDCIACREVYISPILYARVSESIGTRSPEQWCRIRPWMGCWKMLPLMRTKINPGLNLSLV